MAKKIDRLDIIVPVKNEAKNVSELVKRIDQALTDAGIKYRVIFVDDRSTDKTAAKVKELSKKFPVVLHRKRGKPGKAFSIIEGAKIAKTDYLAMIDGDLQYPPEAIPKMAKIAPKHGVVVANRAVYRSHLFRRLASRLNKFLFGRLLFGLRCDVQSGLKVFRREILKQLDEKYLSPWTLDIPLLYTAHGLGFSIGSVPITFKKRDNGQSKIAFLQTAWEIGWRALKLRLTHSGIFYLEPEERGLMLGAGVVHRRRRYVTHSRLHYGKSALVTFTKRQKIFIFSLVLLLVGGMLLNLHLAAVAVIAVLSLIYFLDVWFNLYLILKGLHFPPEIKISPRKLKSFKANQLPVYSILCPLYREARMLPQFVKGINQLDWPKNKLDVLLLLEEDDQETIQAARNLNLPKHFRIKVVPHSVPKTKPKACNYGLALAKGEYVVIYDAEDKPDPLQLKKAFLGFQKVANDVVCLQAKLNYYNPHHNLLTKLFTAEYSLWFDVILPGLQSIETSIPLGGTSNHFRTRQLRKLHAWDPFNVTEDCDLGVRLFKDGFKTAMIDSLTLEEANSKLGNWIRQRSRWLKGYLQTYLVHMRHPWRFFRSHGLHSFLFQLIVGLKISFILINPILWAATISYFALYSVVGPTIESLYPTTVFYLAAFSLVFGNFMYIYNYMIGCAKRGHWPLVKYVLLVPFYWLLMGVGALMAITQLVFKPHFWEKTHHGFHLGLQPARRKRESRRARWAISFGETWAPVGARLVVGSSRVKRLAGSSGVVSGGALVAASMTANFFNFLYNAYLGRTISLEEFGVVSLLSNLLLIIQSTLGALSATVTYRAAYLLGKYRLSAKVFWSWVRGRALRLSVVATGVWIALSPALAALFHTGTMLPFLLFAPVWLVGTLVAVDSGFLAGNLKFAALAAVVLVAPVVKLGTAFTLVTGGLVPWVYAAIPLSMLAALMISWWVVGSLPGRKRERKQKLRFPRRFFGVSLLRGLAVITFLSLDVILVKHYLTPTEAGQYALLALAGKMIFFAGSLFGGFVNPLVSRAVGAGRDARLVFYRLLTLTAVVSVAGYALVGMFGELTVPLLFGPKAYSIVGLLPMYALGIASFTVASSIVTYHQVRQEYLLSGVSVLFALVQLVGITLFHGSVEAVVGVMAAVGMASLGVMAGLHLAYPRLRQFLSPAARIKKDNLRILVFNWRDTKHVWAGGAELYVHELAKRWVKAGHQVTVFCGNDRKNPRNEVIDGVQIVRRGGFFTVYVWAFLYYVLRFRGLFDLVVDCENGIPFFTPLYVRVPKFLVIHHVHQEVFRENLRRPFSWLAMFLEKKLMPLVYRESEIITISESSKRAITRLKLTDKVPAVVHCGVDLKTFVPGKKAKQPLVLYVGRLKAYKNLPVLIRAIKELSTREVRIKLVIAGFGEERAKLERLVKELKLTNWVMFAGRVSEARKVKLYQQAWVAVNPSSMEGWGITSVEANACGTPVVASDVPGLRDSIRNPRSGFLVNYQDPEAFADQIFRIITNRRLRQDLSRSARLWAEWFSWDRSAEECLKIFQTSTHDY